MYKKAVQYCIVIFVCGVFLYGCSKDNIVDEGFPVYSSKYQRAGLLDSIAGDCSTIITHSIPLDSIDFRGASKLVMRYKAYTDADISFLRLFYVSADTSVNVINLEGSSEISNMQSIEADAPQSKQYYYLRMGLRSSVCTGSIFHIKLRDLEIGTK